MSEIKSEEGLTYTTEFIGTMAGYDKKSVARLGADGKPIRATRVYSNDVGALRCQFDLSHSRLRGNDFKSTAEKGPAIRFLRGSKAGTGR